MSKIIKLEYGIESTVQVKPYEFVKPRLVITIELEEGDEVGEEYEKLKAKVENRIAIALKEIKQKYKDKK